jgi:hypothetical protein
MRKITDETDGVCHYEWLTRGQGTAAGGRVECSEEFILS